MTIRQHRQIVPRRMVPALWQAKRECDRESHFFSFAAAPATVIGEFQAPLTASWEGLERGLSTLKAGRPADASICNRRTGCSATGWWYALPPVRLAHPIAFLGRARLMTAILHVCVTCRAGQANVDGGPTPGARLMQAVAAQGAIPGVVVQPVECLSACTQGCSIALSGPGRWTYVYGRLSDADAAVICAGATAYAQSADGIVPWRERPEIFRKQSIARVPPLSTSLENRE